MFRMNRALSDAPRRSMMRLIMLCSVWISGFFIGLYVIFVSPESSISAMRLQLDNPLTLIGLISTQFFPLIISCIIHWLEKPFFILPVVFLKALSFAYCAFGIVVAYGDAGWMIRWLLLFSDSCSVILLLWLWIRNFTGRGVCFNRDILICFLAVMLSCLLDYFAVYPLLLRLSDFL